MNEYMEEAYKEALKAYKKNEVPVGAVIVKNNKIVAKAHNKKEKYRCVASHAEILAIKKASKKLKNWRLNDCEMYVTLEPCMMCTGAILQSRISKIVYATENFNFGFLSKIKDKNIIVKNEFSKLEYKQLLNDFFKNKRK